MNYFYLLIIGIIGGILGGMGMGGGTLLIPMLSIFLNFNQRYCQGLNLIAFIPMCIIVLFIHKRNNLLQLKGNIKIIVAGIIFCVISSIIAQNVNNNTLRIAFGVFLVVLGIFNLIHILFVKEKFNKKI